MKRQALSLIIACFLLLALCSAANATIIKMNMDATITGTPIGDIPLVGSLFFDDTDKTITTYSDGHFGDNAFRLADNFATGMEASLGIDIDIFADANFLITPPVSFLGNDSFDDYFGVFNYTHQSNEEWVVLLNIGGVSLWMDTVKRDGSGAPDLNGSNGFVSMFVNDQTGTFDIANLTIETAPVPEPASMILLGTGLTGIIGLRIRRKKS